MELNEIFDNYKKAMADGVTETTEEAVRKNCKPFDEQVFSSLIPSLRNALAPVFDNPRLYPDLCSSALLMALLCQYSAVMPGVRVLYGTRLYSLNISFLYTAPAGCNKAVTNYAEEVTAVVNRHIRERSEAEIRTWKQKAQAWEVERSTALKEKRAVNQDLDPGEEPKYAMLNIPSSTSKSQLLECLKANEKYGIIMQSSEINSLVDALSKDYGNFTDSLCKALVNEKVDKYYKVDGVPIIIEDPMMSIVLAGSLSQAQNMFPTWEDGLASRFLIMIGKADESWISQRPDYSRGDYRDHYARIAQDVFQMWQLLCSRRITIRFTDQQWDVHDATWAENKSQMVTEMGIDLNAVANRHGFNAMRIASVLTVLRWWETVREKYSHGTDFDYSILPDYLTCHDTDFMVAMSIVNTLFSHALTLATSESRKVVKEMRSWHWSRKTLQLCNEEFSAEDFVNNAAMLGQKKTAAYKALQRLCAKEIIVKTSSRPAVYRKKVQQK